MKKSWLRRYTKYTLVSVNIIIALTFLIGCLLPWLSSKYFGILGFIGFAMPYLFLALFFSILFWLFVKRKIALYFFIVLCCGYKQASVIFAFNTNTTFKKNKANYNIRLVSWNIGNMSGRPQNNNLKRHSIDEIVSSLLKQNADVICLQEFEECRSGCKSLDLIRKKYPYYCFPGWIIGPYRHGSGSAIFSKYPIIKTDSTRFENGENIITADVAINDDTLSFFTTHLDSYKFSKDEFREIDAVAKDETIPKKNYRGIISKLNNTLITHSEQTDVVIDFFSTTKHPIVFCADLNEVANNNNYWRIRGDKQDAFLKKGWGFGKTFNSLSPILRIDYIMPDNNFEVTQFDIVEEGLSDHSLLVTDLMLKKYQSEKTKQ
ncbi:MAG: endonuclease/exonuclease/phosphatase family protein [Chitinophagaceae bacterium]